MTILVISGMAAKFARSRPDAGCGLCLAGQAQSRAE
jgi:hypothetical protein